MNNLEETTIQDIKYIEDKILLLTKDDNVYLQANTIIDAAKSIISAYDNDFINSLNENKLKEAASNIKNVKNSINETIKILQIQD